MAYRHDVFLSYQRGNDWPKYVEKLFLPKFRHWLDAELGDKSKIFFDVKDLETGDAWPNKLAQGLAHSKTMLCLWSRQYFSSQWCKLELAQMLARRKSLDGPDGPPPLILAVLIHDCENVDPSLSDIQRFPLQDYSDPWIAEGSTTEMLMSAQIARLAREVADALSKTPEYDDTWPALVTAEFLRLFRAHPGQNLPPSLG